ncbi:MAG: TIGR01777 family oxidoreductase [Methylococcales bacterium]|nr:TIGR01777 family oxidoreductase [Methylococcales bacterium]
MKILITGGTGLIGRRLCKALLAKGHELTVLSRKPETVAVKCGAAVQAIATLDEWHTDTVFDAVINLAGEPIVDARWTAERKHRLWQSRVSLTEALIQALANATHKPSVLLSGSATGFYGDGGDTILEESRLPATDFGGQLCSAWESVAQTADAFGVRVCLLRTGLVLDSSGGLLGRMLLPFKLGLAARLGDGKQWMSWIHVDDYVAIVLLLLENQQAMGAYNMTAPEPVTNSEFTQTLAQALHRPALFVAPAFLLKLLLGEMSVLLLGGQRALPTKLQTLGYDFSYTNLEAALKSLL